MVRVVWTSTLFVSACALSACAAGERDLERTNEAEPIVARALRAPSAGGPATSALVFYALDAWAQPLARGFELTVRDGEFPAELAGENPYVLPLYDARTYRVALVAPEHEPIAIDVFFDGTGGETSVLVDGAIASDAISVTHDRATVEGREVWIHRVYLGLRHRWFSASGRPARHHNAVDLLVAGEEAWASVHADLERANDSILLSTWWWDSTFELVRDGTSSAATRRANTVLEVLRQSPAQKRVIVGQLVGQDGLLKTVTTDAELRSHGERTDDRFEFMGQANPSRGVFWFEVAPFFFADRVTERVPNALFHTFDYEFPIESTVPPHLVDLTAWPISVDVEHASYHQKFVVIDHSVAFVGGMNFRVVDWDSDQHLVYDPRRMELDASAAARAQVAARTRLPDAGPRRDYMVRVEGPAAQDVAEVFDERWDFLRESGARYSNTTTDFDVVHDVAPLAPGLDVQITTTMPAPFFEHSIAETWFNAIGNAERFIYIEDQYFRIPMLVDAIIDRMYEKPDLRLVVITKPVSEWTDPGCYWTHRTHADLAGRFSDRYLLLQLRSFDVSRNGFGIDETDEHFTNIDLHSKMLIVDDVFMSVGSANKNNRGVEYEAEMNVAIVSETWVGAARRRILENLLGPTYVVSDDPIAWFDMLERAAAWNRSTVNAWQQVGGDLNLNGAALPRQYVPHGFVHPLPLPAPSECLIESIGPDMV
jgi:phosphatidylserine/phosphatidylglycerophosphate/cardiolipin synthase-like enzyme